MMREELGGHGSGFGTYTSDSDTSRGILGILKLRRLPPKRGGGALEEAPSRSESVPFLIA